MSGCITQSILNHSTECHCLEKSVTKRFIATKIICRNKFLSFLDWLIDAQLLKASGAWSSFILASSARGTGFACIFDVLFTWHVSSYHSLTLLLLMVLTRTQNTKHKLLFMCKKKIFKKHTADSV
jgi:hypothetical protein